MTIALVLEEDLSYLRDKILITSHECMTKPQNVYLQFSENFLLLFKYNFRPFWSFLGLEEKILKIFFRRLFFSNIFPENLSIDTS